MKNKPAPAQTPSELLNDLHALVVETEKMMGEAVSGHTIEAVNALRARYEAAHERVGEFCAVARKRVVAGAQCADVAIRGNPYRAIAIAAGVALLAGVILARRRP